MRSATNTVRGVGGAALAVVIGVATVPAAQADQAEEDPASTGVTQPGADRPGTAAEGAASCPDTVILASRGSEENDPAVPGELDRYSDGWEGASVRRFLEFTLAEHPEAFADGTTRVTGIDADHYPARLPLPGPGEEVTLPGLVDGGVQFVDSMVRGIPGGEDQVTAWEDSTGCRPDYITVGYSQGEIPLLAVQQHAASDGRLAGVIAFGNPLTAVPGPVPAFPGVPAGTPALDYCVPDDVVCDTNPRSAYLALTDDEDAGVHADYFKDAVAGSPSDGDRAAADTLAGWLTARTPA